MSVEIYCGEPPANIVQWIRDNAQPAGNPKTVITFTDGDTLEYDWSGEITNQTRIDAGLFDEDEYTWIKNPQVIEIGTNVTSIGNGAFSHSDSLTSVTIPSSVTSIDGFSYCSSLTNLTIPDSVTSIGDYAFDTCESLTSMMIPESVMNIGENAFIDCRGLTSVVFKGKTLAQVQGMENYPWGIEDTSIISVEP